MCASSDVRNFSVFSFHFFLHQNYENNMLVRLAMVSCFNGFVRKNLAQLLSSRIYVPFCADSNLTNASQYKTPALLLATRLDSDRQSEKTLTPRTFMTRRRPRNRLLHLNFSKILILGKGKLSVRSSLCLLNSDVNM